MGMKKDKIRLPKLEGYAEREGFILVAIRNKNSWIAAQTDIIPKSMADLSEKQRNNLLRDHCQTTFEAVQELYERDNPKGTKRKSKRNNPKQREVHGHGEFIH